MFMKNHQECQSEIPTMAKTTKAKTKTTGLTKAGNKKRIRIDKRPICNCKAYKHPHKIGGKCKGQAFTEFYFYNVRVICNECNCMNDGRCDVVDGLEEIKEAECYREHILYNENEHLPLDFKE